MIIKLNIDGVDYAVTAIVPLPPPPVASPTGLFLIPSGVTPTIVDLDTLDWLSEKDTGTPGTATGTTSYPVDIGGRTTARLFTSDFTGFGGYRHHVHYANDETADHFIYAGDLYIDSIQPIAQLELDNNQVTVDGSTYIFGSQMNMNDKSWDVCSTNGKNCHWNGSTLIADPSKLLVGEWLHFEIMSHRDSAGNVTYDAINFNGTTTLIGKTYPSSLKLNWSLGACLVNLQLGGNGAAGSIKLYGSNMQVARW